MLDYFMDGACCATVLVRTDGQQLAAVVGEILMQREGKGGEPIQPPKGAMLVAQHTLGGWVQVELPERADAGKGRYIDSDPLLIQAIAVCDGHIPDVKWGYTEPVTVAHRLSEQLATDALAVWGSDQGPGLGGIARFEKGQLIEVFSAASPQGLQVIDDIRDREEDEDEDTQNLDDLMDQVDAYEGKYTYHRSAEGGGDIEGHVSTHANTLLKQWNLSIETAVEPVWAWSRELAKGVDISDHIAHLFWVKLTSS